jgi:prepilin-type N-terminal cleavage/methylation domain-containing protein
MTCPPRRSAAGRGFTLLELIVVVVILTVMATMAWPSMRKMYVKGEIQDAAKQVRQALLRARLEAIETGTTQVFRFQPGTGRFEVVGKAEADGVADSTVVASDDMGLGDLSGASVESFGDPSAFGDPMSDPLYGVPTWESLGHKIQFAGQDLDDRTMARVNAAEDGNPLESPLAAPTDQDFSESGLGGNPLLGADPLTGLAPAASLTGTSGEEQWSVPIVFYPNGRTSNARIRLTDQDEYYIDVSLRGLTGGARISKVRRWQEQLQQELTGTDPSGMDLPGADGFESGLLEEVPLEEIQ